MQKLKMVLVSGVLVAVAVLSVSGLVFSDETQPAPDSSTAAPAMTNTSSVAPAPEADPRPRRRPLLRRRPRPSKKRLTCPERSEDRNGLPVQSEAKTENLYRIIKKPPATEAFLFQYFLTLPVDNAYNHYV